MNNKHVIILIYCLLCSFVRANAQSEISSFVEAGTSLHAGDHTPLWQVSLQHGLSSLDQNAYLRGGSFYTYSHRLLQLNGGLDMATSVGMESHFVIQQAYGELRYKALRIEVGSWEHDAPLLNQELTSGGLTWSGNARPIPQILVGMTDYRHVFFRWFSVKAELSYGWFTDGSYQEKRVEDPYFHTRGIKYHHKALFTRFDLSRHWTLDVAMQMDAQFGGYKYGGQDEGNLGNGLKNYLHALIPHSGDDDSPAGAQIAYDGNILGSEHIKLNYLGDQYNLHLYLENFYDDFSGMLKVNGLDGLWGLEWENKKSGWLRGLLIEYYQTKNQSGCMHGLDNSIVKKTNGADDYYNNVWYPGWSHYGMTMGNPLVASPLYNEDGDLSFRYNRVKALHLAMKGRLSKELFLIGKCSFNETWGTPFRPTLDVLKNMSIFAEVIYRPRNIQTLELRSSLATDIGKIYGRNEGFKLTIRKGF